MELVKVAARIDGGPLIGVWENILLNIQETISNSQSGYDYDTDKSTKEVANPFENNLQRYRF